jgi:hypothetical protein
MVWIKVAGLWEHLPRTLLPVDLDPENDSNHHLATSNNRVGPGVLCKFLGDKGTLSEDFPHASYFPAKYRFLYSIGLQPLTCLN